MRALQVSRERHLSVCRDLALLAGGDITFEAVKDFDQEGRHKSSSVALKTLLTTCISSSLGNRYSTSPAIRWGDKGRCTRLPIWNAIPATAMLPKRSQPNGTKKKHHDSRPWRHATSLRQLTTTSLRSIARREPSRFLHLAIGTCRDKDTPYTRSASHRLAVHLEWMRQHDCRACRNPSSIRRHQ